MSVARTIDPHIGKFQLFFGTRIYN